jgi:pyrimidine-nucleoside phosphorylase
VTELTLDLAAEMLALAGTVRTRQEALPLLKAKLASGAALAVFRTMVQRHGGDVRVIDRPELLPAARVQRPLPARADGYVKEANAEKIGRASLLLGAGRTKTTDTIDPAAGLSRLAKVGEQVSKGQPLAILHAASEERIAAAMPLAAEAFAISPDPVAVPPLIEERL